VSTSHVANLAL
jgi:hypothetical protein